MKSKAYHSYLIKAFFLSDVSCDQKPFVTKSTYFVFKTKVLPVIESQLGTHLFLRKKAFICCWLSSLFGVTLHRQRTRWVKTFGTTWTDLSSQERDQHHFCFPCQINRKLILKNRDECDWLRWLILTFFQFDDYLFRLTTNNPRKRATHWIDAIEVNFIETEPHSIQCKIRHTCFKTFNSICVFW